MLKIVKKIKIKLLKNLISKLEILFNTLFNLLIALTLDGKGVLSCFGFFLGFVWKK